MMPGSNRSGLINPCLLELSRGIERCRVEQLTDLEIADRLIAATKAIANTEMEGLAISTAAKADLAAFAVGSMPVEVAIERAKARHDSRNRQ